MDMKLEVVPLPVRDVDAAKDFYSAKVGFTVDHDVSPNANMRIVQMTPPGSACSVVIGVGLPLGEPGSVKGVQLVVEDLDAVRSELKGLREQLRQLQAFPPAAPDIAARVRGYVTTLANQALPMVRGYHAGGALEVRWPASLTCDRRNGNGFDSERANPLLLMASLDPDELGEMIIRSVVAEQPLSAHEHAERCREITARIDALSYSEAALSEQAGIEFDPGLEPRHVLGVRLDEAESGEAAA